MPAMPLETAMAAVQSQKEIYAENAVLPDHEQGQPVIADKNEQIDDLDLTVSFIGCPSNSTRIIMPTEDPINDVKSTSETLRPENEWQQIQGQNNNRCSDSNEGGFDNDQENDSSEDLQEERQSPRCRQTIGSRERRRNSSSSPARNNSIRRDREAAANEETPDCSRRDTKQNSRYQNSDPYANCFGQNVVNISKGYLDEVKPGKAANTEEGSPAQQTRKSTTSINGYARIQNSRMHRSPQQRKKKGDYAQGSSAPVPFVPMPAQGSLGCTDIIRPSSVSPSRKDIPDKNNAQRPSSAQDNFIKGTNMRYREAVESVSGPHESRRNIPAKPPSPSFGASDLHHREESKAPSQSSARSDLRNSRRGLNQSDQPLGAADPYQMPCQLILPDDPCCTGAPHGDIEQTSPQKSWQQFLEQQHISGRQGKKTSGPQPCNQSPTIKDHSTDVKTHNSEISATPWDNLSNIAGKKRGKDETKISLSTSTGTLKGSNTGRTRSSRRHPVLDKMFRHVLASLVMESGPPSSACLASVVDQVEGSGASESLWSQSITSSSVSATDTFTSRLSNCRFGKNSLSKTKDNHRSQNDQEDDTMPLPSPLPCSLQKVNEESKA